MLLYLDEAVNGYDAYSILKTGHTIFGEYWPLFAKSTGDFRETIYHYLSIPFIYLFGLNEFSVKIVSFIFFFISIIFVYKISLEVFENRKIAVFTSLFFTFNPQNLILFSLAFRMNIFIGLFLVGLYYFIKFLKLNKGRYLIISTLFFSITLWSYFSARVFVPLFMVSILLVYYKEFLTVKKEFFLSLLIFLSIFIYLFSFWISPQGMARANTEVEYSLIKPILNYMLYLDPYHLFLYQKKFSFMPENSGVFLFIELPFYLLGFYYFIRKKLYNDKIKKILLILLFLSPIPANFTGPLFEPMFFRAHILKPWINIFSAFGLVEFLEYLHYRRNLTYSIIKRVTYMFYILVTINILYSLYSRFYLYPAHRSYLYNYGIKEIIEESKKSKYKNVYLSDKLYFFYYYIAFYEKIDPKYFEKYPIKFNLNTISPFNGIKIKKYIFVDISKIPITKEKSLIIERGNLPETIIKSYPYLKLLKKIVFPYNNKILYTLIEYN